MKNIAIANTSCQKGGCLKCLRRQLYFVICFLFFIVQYQNLYQMQSRVTKTQVIKLVTNFLINEASKMSEKRKSDNLTYGYWSRQQLVK